MPDPAVIHSRRNLNRIAKSPHARASDARPVAIRSGKLSPCSRPPCAKRVHWPISAARTFVAKPNYSFEKRQRELAQKKKQEEKDAKKRAERAARAPVPETP